MAKSKKDLESTNLDNVKDNSTVNKQEVKEIVSNEGKLVTAISNSNKLVIIFLTFVVLLAGSLIGMKVVVNNTKLTGLIVAQKPGPLNQWNINLYPTLSPITTELQSLGNLSGSARVQLCGKINKDLVNFSSNAAPAPDTEIQDLFSSWISTTGTAMNDCANNKPSAKAELDSSYKAFQKFENKLLVNLTMNK